MPCPGHTWSVDGRSTDFCARLRGARRRWCIAALWLLICLAGCDDATTRVCFSSSGGYCNLVVVSNSSPDADAGVDQSVISGATVSLDGTDSRDPGGSIDDYAWVQTSGPSVAITAADTATPTFVAPVVAATTTLRFRLTVTDNNNASDSDEVDVTVEPEQVAALKAGLNLLKTLYRPEPLAGLESTADFSAFVGLWTAAGVRAAKQGFDVDILALLDELRVLSQLQTGWPTGRSAKRDPSVLPSIFELGQSDLAAFTSERDPAISELAQQATPVMGPIAVRTWLEALSSVEWNPQLTPATVADRQRAAQRLILDADEGTAPEAVASAVLFMLLSSCKIGSGIDDGPTGC